MCSATQHLSARGDTGRRSVPNPKTIALACSATRCDQCSAAVVGTLLNQHRYQRILDGIMLIRCFYLLYKTQWYLAVYFGEIQVKLGAFESHLRFLRLIHLHGVYAAHLTVWKI